MNYVQARLLEPSTRAAIIFAAGHLSTLFASTADISPRDVASVLLMALVVALTPEAQQPVVPEDAPPVTPTNP